MKKKHESETAKRRRGAAPLLACVAELKPIREQLATLSAKYRGVGEDRIAWEVMAAVGALDNTIELAELYDGQR